jgi:hypothetical protein
MERAAPSCPIWETTIDQQALAYYRCAWAVQDLGSFAESIFQTPAASDATRHAALHGFVSTLAPRAIVDLALASIDSL